MTSALITVHVNNDVNNDYRAVNIEIAPPS